jgi:hypothetical protein
MRYDISMRSRVFSFALLFVVGSFALPYVAHAGGVPFFGPIIPTAINRCPAGWTTLITVINNIISFMITIVIVFIAPLGIAYAGFLMVIHQNSESGLGKAKEILKNIVVGVLIALTGWMIVDAIMAVLYNASAPNGSGGVLGTWSSLIYGNANDPCLIQAGALTNLNETAGGPGVTGVTANSSGVSTNGKTVQCARDNTACSPSALQQGAKAINMTLTDAQAQAMSCIAVTESSGNPGTPNSNTGACGTFQITTQPGNWSNTAYHQSPCSTSSSCNDPQCNMQTALIMLNKQGYQPWTGKNPNGTYWNANAVACVQHYDSGS